MPELKIRILRRDNYTCRFCGHYDRARMTLDHLIPKGWGGSNDPSNLVATCEKCNGEKASVGLYEVLRRHPEIRKKLGPLLDRATPPKRPEKPEEGEKEAQDVHVKIEVGKFPAASDVLAGAGAFVCPIFEEAWPLKERRKTP